MTQPSLFAPTLPPPAVVNQRRNRAMRAVAQKAEDLRPNFGEQARAFVLGYLAFHGPTSGELLTVACKGAGIVPHDDRAFGSVYQALVRRGRIVKAGECRRERGHGTSGGTVWALVTQ